MTTRDDDFQVQVFEYHPEFDGFTCTEQYRRIAYGLRIAEWHPTVWIGRLFTLDNDYGEHWLDNRDQRCELAERDASRGLVPFRFFVLDPERLMNENDGPCHSPMQRARFWTDVLKSLKLSWSTLVEEALATNEQYLRAGVYSDSDDDDQGYVPDIEERIRVLREELRREYGF